MRSQLVTEHQSHLERIKKDGQETMGLLAVIVLLVSRTGFEPVAC